MRWLVRLQAIGAAWAILFTGSVVADDWPYYQHDAQHTSNSTAIVDPQALSWAWTAPSFYTGGYSTPVIVGNTIYAIQNQGGYSGGGIRTRLTSFDLATGAINWTYSGSFVFPSQPGVGGGFVTFAVDASLYVLDAVTGRLRYTVPILARGAAMPTIVRDPVTGHVTAFVADGSRVSAVSLGAASGTVLWTQDGLFGGFSIPTVVGNSIVLTGPGQYYAFNQATGAANHFWAGNIYGGGGSTVAYDAIRHQFYIVDSYNDSTRTLSAYHYTDNSHIRLLWQRTGDGVGSESVAIGPSGKVYSAGGTVIWELDPVTGATLRSITGTFAGTPALTNNVLWILGDGQTMAYDLVTLQLLRALNGGGSNTGYRSPGAFTDGYIVLDYGDVVGSPSFDVYSSPLPNATTNRATNVASFSATLNGSVNARGSPTSVHLEYGLTTSYGSATVMQTKTGHAPRVISANVTGLLPSRLYHFRIVAHNSHGTSFGHDRTFSTLSPTGAPIATTNPATLVASFSATLHALLDPHGLTTSVHFQYGPTSRYGFTTAPGNMTGDTYRNVAVNLRNLTPSTTYHFRIVASNTVGTRFGSDNTFATLTATGPPVVTTKSASNVSPSSVTLNGLLDPHGLTTTVNFQYGTTVPFYEHSTPIQVQTGNTYRPITANISGLTPHTTYHFRIVGTNRDGGKGGSDRTFTTH